MEYYFEIKGTSGTYKVIVRKDGDIASASCSCAAGIQGMHCKHRIALLTGDTSKLLSTNYQEALNLKEFIRETTLERALIEFREAESNYERTKKELSARKKALARIMSPR